MTTKTIAGQEHRFRAFQISERDLALLAALAGFARERLPSLLPQLHEQFAPWPEIAKALSQPQVHERRLAHWIRLASGDFGEGFTESARSLATAFHEHGVPIYAVVICHGIVVNALIAELGLDQRRLTSLSGRWRRTRLDTGIATRAALSKAAQFDLELLLETYALVEQDRRDATRRQIEAFEGTVRDVVSAVGSGAVKVESLAATMEAVVGETSAQAFKAVRTADDASSNVSNVAAPRRCRRCRRRLARRSRRSNASSPSSARSAGSPRSSPPASTSSGLRRRRSPAARIRPRWARRRMPMRSAS
ncbi:protoglobin domain-containing protein [Bosea sp. TAB14]|uniref:protoglobin domain-containing protein n=1 Tax=Bosea sp. TAB14 TaxID=3237481 RepID=UPI003F902C61